MKTLVFSSLVLVAFIFSRCENSLKDNPSKGNMNVTEVKSALVDANNIFALNIFKAIYLNEADSANIFISPLSIYYALSLTGSGANGETLEAFNKVLAQEGYDTQTMLEAIAGLYTDIIPNGDKVTVEIANSLWPDNDFPIREHFVDNAKEYFDAEVRNIDYAVDDAAGIINEWIEEKTHDKIQNMLSDLPEETVLALVNAIYFKGDWKYQFADTSNKIGDFYLSNGGSKVLIFMKQRATFEYLENNLFTSIKMPYVDSNYFMIVLLPTTDKTITDVVSELNNSKWQTWMDNYAYEIVNITFPKFKYSFGTREIMDELKSMGLEIAFSDFADFSGISERSTKIDKVLHKAFIEVNEKGSEAAAATVVTMIETTSNGGSNDPEKYFTADHPFLFAICEKKTNSIMFMGKVACPLQ